MAGLAGLAAEKGHKVTGQDKSYYPPMSSLMVRIGSHETPNLFNQCFTVWMYLSPIITRKQPQVTTKNAVLSLGDIQVRTQTSFKYYFRIRKNTQANY